MLACGAELDQWVLLQSQNQLPGVPERLEQFLTAITAFVPVGYV